MVFKTDAAKKEKKGRWVFIGAVTRWLLF